MNLSINQNRIAPTTTVIKICMSTKIIPPSSLTFSRTHTFISEINVRARRQSFYSEVPADGAPMRYRVSRSCGKIGRTYPSCNVHLPGIFGCAAGVVRWRGLKLATRV
jgi:hypothetical protein